VLPARVERLAGARFRLTVFPRLPLPCGGDRHADVAELTALVNATLEAGIRERPELALKATEQPVDTGTAAGKAFLDMLGVSAEFETNLRRERQPWLRIDRSCLGRTCAAAEIVAVGTARQETAKAAARHYQVQHAFADVRELARHPDIDLVTVSVK
jgi:hypothetical protein